jgi:NADH:ubiquinone oxidoreductase subunit E
MLIQICIGSSCHIKGAPEIVELLQNAVSDNALEDKVTLTGSFCTGKCNREGVTVTVDEEVYTGITRDNFREFFQTKVLDVMKEEGK